MKKLLITTVAAAGLFFRLGRGWTKEGIVVDADAFTDEEWAVLAAEPMLHIGPAPEDAIVHDPSETGLYIAVRDAISKLEAADFGEDGTPRADAVRKHLPGTKGVTKELVAHVWRELKPVS